MMHEEPLFKVTEAREEDYSDTEIGKALFILNGLCWDLSKGYYLEGGRNDIAVDLCCSCFVLKLDPYMVARKVLQEYAIGTRYDMMNDLEDRIEVIDPYLETWNGTPPNGVFDFMIDPEYLENHGEIYLKQEGNVPFVILSQ